MSSAASLVWFRLDLRLEDNPALLAALARGGPVVPVYIWAPEEEGRWAPGGASRWWLHHSLESLRASLRERGAQLIIRRGPSLQALRELLAETGADAVYWNRRYEPAVIARDKEIKVALRDEGGQAESFNAALLHEPWTVTNRGGKPYGVFAPFWRAYGALPPPPPPEPLPAAVPAPGHWPDSLPLTDLELEPKIDWAAGMRETWRPGEPGSLSRLDRFVTEALTGYAGGRDRPGQRATSTLSPHLHWGELGPRQVWHAVSGRMRGEDAEAYLRELGWRDFAYHLLYHHPHFPEQPLDPKFAAFPFRDDPRELRAWQRGRTGYPIVDAGMRQLWRLGWMHNRVRMVTASFLVKDLLMPWQRGEEWFWDTLVDADLASNTTNWQWVAGSGADPAPFFRIFNPVTQGEKFDPEGEYIRSWVPELARLPDRYIQKPWEAPPDVLSAAGVVLGQTYPHTIVEHATARKRALDAFATIQAEPTRSTGPA